jgi:methylated-DNA-[protein]-cysteine S-methyltransferase
MRARTATVRIESPVGALTISADDNHLLALRIGRGGGTGDMAAITGETDHPILRDAVTQLLGWFAGTCQLFDLPLAPLGTQEATRLRTAIASIPFGQTLTYGALGNRAGSVARAVGQACKTNAFPIIIPCHRVTSTHGPEYYSGGDGPRTKTWLLDFEYAHLPPEQRTRLI